MFFKKKEVTLLTWEEIVEPLGAYSQLEEGRGQLLGSVLSQSDLPMVSDVIINFLEGDLPDHFESALEILFLLLTKERSVPGKWGTELKNLLLEKGQIPGVFKVIFESGNFLKIISILSHMRALESVYSSEDFAAFYSTLKEKNFGLLYFFLVNFAYYEDGHLREEWVEDLVADGGEAYTLVLLSLVSRFEVDLPVATEKAQASLTSEHPFLVLMAKAFLRRPSLIEAIQNTHDEDKQQALMEEFEKVHAVLDLDEAITKSYLQVMKDNKNVVTSELLFEGILKWVKGPSTT